MDYYRNLKRLEPEKFLQTLEETPWDTAFVSDEIDGQTVTTVELSYTQTGGNDVLIARKYPGQALQILAASGYSGRISSSGDATFTISNIVKSDSRTFECKVSFTDINNLWIRDFVEVIVVDPAKIVKLASEYEVAVGQSVSLHCQAEGNPKPTYIWTPCESVCHESTLNIPGVLSDGVYTCKVTNGLGSDAKIPVLP
ncbi:Protein turtle A-like [Desmophyllum pertusum]|uniref:Protein turtle A-like n=1 Tax=Desmophyllum pertusum TaxID=174260 RepID=A0A9W9Y7M4_9CNID|nr:Protein turtle A-like [Desmophyllum pertusum]